MRIMKQKYIFNYILLLLFCISCSNSSQVNNNIDTAKIGVNASSRLSKNEKIINYKKSFFDSVLSKSYLSLTQITRHVNIDTDYITSESKFKGDTVFYSKSNYPIVIVDVYGPTCGYKFILIFERDGIRNISYKLGESDCDEDESSNYSSLTYKLINDRNFYTQEKDYERKAGHKTKVTLTNVYYRINKDGKIDSLRSTMKESYKLTDDDDE
jgi:hypothetical protein